MNPYSGVGFFEFFGVLFQRLFSGALFTEKWVSDEIQLATLVCSAIACGVIGPFVVLKRLAMFANSLSHTTLIGIVLAYLLLGSFSVSTLLLGALIAASLTAGLIELFTRALRLSQDASIGLVFTALFAGGITLVTLFTKHAHLSVEAVIGHPDALRTADLALAASIALMNGVVVAVCTRKLSLIAFDESCARTLGVSVGFWRLVLLALTTFTCIGAFRAVGVLVVLGLLVVPYWTVRPFAKRLTSLLWWTPSAGVLACAMSVALSRAILSAWGVALSTSGLLAVVLALFWSMSAFCTRAKTSRLIT